MIRCPSRRDGGFQKEEKRMRRDGETGLVVFDGHGGPQRVEWGVGQYQLDPVLILRFLELEVRGPGGIGA